MSNSENLAFSTSNTDPNSFFDFGLRQFCITYKCGRLLNEKRSEWERPQYSRTESIFATGSDITDAIAVLKTFKHEVLTKIHGRNWHTQDAEWWFWESYPETKGRNSWENTNLHFHTILSGSAIAKLPIEKLNDICQKASHKIGFRLFGWNPSVDVQEVKTLAAWRRYSLKNQQDHEVGFGGLTLMSENVPRLDFSRRKGNYIN